MNWRRPNRTWMLFALELAVFGYVTWFRTAGVSESFWIHADQIRDWQIALRRFTDLPLVGPPSLAGGNTVGPVYYWILWVIARTVGPWVDYLPHAGGVGIAVLQGIGDVALVHALAVRLRSVGMAVAIVLAIATSAPDAALSATIWNPPVAVALSKLAIALALFGDLDRAAWLAAVTALAWMAVQAHTTTLPVTLAVVAWAVLHGSSGSGERGSRAGLVATVVAILQVPWLAHQLTVAAAPASTPMGASVTAVLRDPLGALRPLESLRAMLNAIPYNASVPVPAVAFGVMLVVGTAALVWLSRDSWLKVLAAGPLVTVVALYAVWQGALTENYWYLPLSVPAALALLAWLSAVDARIRLAASLTLVALVLIQQPARVALTRHTLRTPIYGALVRGARSVIQSGYAIQEIRTTFPMPEGTDQAYVYSLLGGRLDGRADTRAIVNAAGAITLETIR